MYKYVAIKNVESSKEINKFCCVCRQNISKGS